MTAYGVLVDAQRFPTCKPSFSLSSNAQSVCEVLGRSRWFVRVDDKGIDVLFAPKAIRNVESEKTDSLEPI